MLFRWIIIVFLLLVLLSWLPTLRLPWLEKLGLTRFNSSLDFKLFGRHVQLPVTLAVVLCVGVVWLIQTLFNWK
jgi:hypothetical protein